MTTGSFVGNLAGVNVNPENIHFLKTPEEFYHTLIERIGAAKSRVYLSALYLGTGDLEKKLVSKLEECLRGNPNINIKLLFDYLRGTRGGNDSSAGILQHLAHGLEAFFFHTPDLRGIPKKYLPERVNEIVGLQHMKFFIFDDTIILSGANLSDTYFTNRQDRYVVIENTPKLVEFFVAMFEAVSSCSFQLSIDGTLKEACDCHPFQGNAKEYKEMLLSKANEAITLLNKDEPISDTIIYPIIQMGAFGIKQEESLMKNIFKERDDNLEVTLATGYLNLYNEYEDLILNKANFPVDIVFASPEANGFYRAKGISGSIPALYVYISELLLQKINALERNIRLLEFRRDGWSFHAKGIWINSKMEDYTATVIGSSNFGYRSTIRDLEAQIMIVTRNEMLKRRINEERNLILESTTQLDSVVFLKPDHYVPWWMPFFLASGGLLVREFVRRIKPVQRNGAIISTRGLFTATSRRSQRRRVKCMTSSSNPFSPDELRLRMGGFAARRLASTSSQDGEQNEWIPVYRYRKIGMCFFVARAKFYQTVLSVGLIPWQTYRMVMGTCSLNEYFTVMGLAFIAPLVLIGFANVFNRIIGVISYNPEKDVFRFGYLSFWGKRTNKTVRLEDVVPLPDLYNPYDDKVILKMGFKDGDYLFLSTRNTELPDEKLARILFKNLHYFPSDNLSEK